jgi:hypothetical protein
LLLKQKRRRKKAEAEAKAKEEANKKVQPPTITLKPYDITVWRGDPDLVDLRHRVNDNFRKVFHEGIKAYIDGDWNAAKTKFNRTTEISKGNGPPDGPSKFLLDFMESYGGVAPADWKGYRIDG